VSSEPRRSGSNLEVIVKRMTPWGALLALSACLPLAACRHEPSVAAAEEDREPAKVEHLRGALPTRVTLTEDAAQRLGIETAAVRDTVIGGERLWVIPYAAVLYDTGGNTWTYTNPRPLLFDRYPIRVESIEGDEVVLSASPPSGTRVVKIGAEELYGAEIEFEEE
jgi:hypothetical protein